MVYLCILGVLFLSLWNQAQVLADGGCTVQGISADEWSTQKTFEEEVKDNDTEKIIFSGKYSNIKSVSPCDSFFCIKLDETKKEFQIVKSPDFKLDGNEAFERVNSSTQTQEITSKINVQCSDGTNPLLTFKITVRDTNNYAPAFKKTSYSYKLPMPMTPKNSITNLGDEIVVQDFDFSNQNVKFTSDFGDLSYETRYGDKGTFSYILQLEFTKVQKLTTEKKFTLTATDSGTPPLSSTATVTFSIDEEISEPPSFTEPSYLYDYDKDQKQIKARGDGLKLTENSWTDLKCTIPDATYSSFFNEITLKGVEVQLSLKKPFDDETMSKQILQVPIQCYHLQNIGTSDASIIISFPEISTDTVYFKNKKYTAQYVINKDGSHEIKMTDPIILVGSQENIILAVEDELKDYFGFKTDTSGFVLTSIKELSQEQLKGTEMSIIVKLFWKNVGTEIDDAFITLLLPNGEEGVDFAQPIFTGEYDYSDDGEGNMDPIQITLSNSNVEMKECGLDDSDYKEFFTLSCDDPAKLSLKLKKNLPENLLRTGTVPLSIWIDLSFGNIQRRIKSAVLLNLTYKGETTTSTTTTSTTTTSTTTTSTTDPPEADDCSHTGWIIVTIVLFILLVAYVIVSVVYYLKRIRGSTDSDFSESQKRTPKIEPHPHKRTSEKFKDVSTRRPTGFIRYNPDQDRTSVDSEYGDAQEELNNNTNANKKSSNIDEEFRRISEEGNHNRRNIGFVIPTPPPEPPTKY